MYHQAFSFNGLMPNVCLRKLIIMTLLVIGMIQLLSCKKTALSEEAKYKKTLVPVDMHLSAEEFAVFMWYYYEPKVEILDSGILFRLHINYRFLDTVVVNPDTDKEYRFLADAEHFRRKVMGDLVFCYYYLSTTQNNMSWYKERLSFYTVLTVPTKNGADTTFTYQHPWSLSIFR